MNRKFIQLACALLIAIGAVQAVPLWASAHSKSVQRECVESTGDTEVTINLTDYPSDATATFGGESINFGTTHHVISAPTVLDVYSPDDPEGLNGWTFTETVNPEEGCNQPATTTTTQPEVTTTTTTIPEVTTTTTQPAVTTTTTTIPEVTTTTTQPAVTTTTTTIPEVTTTTTQPEVTTTTTTIPEVTTTTTQPAVTTTTVAEPEGEVTYRRDPLCMTNGSTQWTYTVSNGTTSVVQVEFNEIRQGSSPNPRFGEIAIGGFFTETVTVGRGAVTHVKITIDGVEITPLNGELVPHLAEVCKEVTTTTTQPAQPTTTVRPTQPTTTVKSTLPATGIEETRNLLSWAGAAIATGSLLIIPGLRRKMRD